MPGNSYAGGAAVPAPQSALQQPPTAAVLAGGAATVPFWRRLFRRPNDAASVTTGAHMLEAVQHPQKHAIACWNLQALDYCAGAMPAHVGDSVRNTLLKTSHCAASDASRDPELTFAGDADGYAASMPPALAADQKLRVTALDSGTYPMDGGGVATCRQIVLEGLPDVVWSCQAEIANDLKQVNCDNRRCSASSACLHAASAGRHAMPIALNRAAAWLQSPLQATANRCQDCSHPLLAASLSSHNSNASLSCTLFFFPLQVIPKFVPGEHTARVDLVPQWDLQHESPAQSLAAAVPFHELSRRCLHLPPHAHSPSPRLLHFIPLLLATCCLWRCCCCCCCCWDPAAELSGKTSTPC